MTNDTDDYDAECHDARCESKATKVLFTEGGNTVPACDTHGENWPEEKTLSLQTDTDEQQQDFEDEWAQLDEKVILVQILSELQRLNQTLTAAETGASDDREATTTYACTKCEAAVPADGREQHARKEHNAPPGMEADLFEEVDG